jgi:hypothetical protein
LFWLLPWTFFFISWIVALARMAPAGITLSARIIQILGALIVLPLVMLVIHVNADLGASVPWMQIGFFAALLIAVFIPHRLTLPLQGSLLAIVLLQMYSQIPIPVDWAILAHTSFCVAACWGCQGDAVKDAPAVDRLPEFLLCVFAGFVGASITFAIVVPLVFAQGPGPIVEYTVALIGGVIVRIIPWPKAHEAQQKSPTASRPSGFENISAN